MTKHVLSIMGGGIRGILAACALVQLEKQTGKLTRDCFGFIGGTSTGALLTAAIAAGVPAQASLDVYLKHGRAIFSPTDTLRRKFNLITKGRQFDVRVLRDVLGVALGSAAGWKINDSPVDILITATNQLGDTWYFTRDRASNASTSGSALLVDAATASACATTYHDPWEIQEYGYFADGGCGGVADPVYQVCVEAFFGRKCYGTIDPATARVISLGTGFYKPAAMVAPPDNLLDRVSWVTSALVGSSKTIAAATVDRHWPGVLQVLNPALSADTDEAAVDQIPVLLALGQETAKNIDWLRILRGN